MLESEDEKGGRVSCPADVCCRIPLEIGQLAHFNPRTAAQHPGQDVVALKGPRHRDIWPCPPPPLWRAALEPKMVTVLTPASIWMQLVSCTSPREDSGQQWMLKPLGRLLPESPLARRCRSPLCCVWAGAGQFVLSAERLLRRVSEEVFVRGRCRRRRHHHHSLASVVVEHRSAQTTAAAWHALDSASAPHSCSRHVPLTRCIRRPTCAATHRCLRRACACAAPPARRSLLLIRLCLIMAYVWLMTAACNGYPSWPNITDGPAGQPGFISVDGIVWWVGLGWEAAAGARASADAALLWRRRTLTPTPPSLPPPSFLPPPPPPLPPLFPAAVGPASTCSSTAPPCSSCCATSGASPSSSQSTRPCGSSSTAAAAWASWSSRR